MFSCTARLVIKLSFHQRVKVRSLHFICLHLPPDFRALCCFSHHCSHWIDCEDSSLLLEDSPGATSPSSTWTLASDKPSL